MDRFDTVAITRRVCSLLHDRFRATLPLVGLLALGFVAANLARALFPGLYVFDPFDQGWLLIPEALWFGPVLALMHHRILAPGSEFAWSRDNRLIKLGKAAACYYGLIVLLKVGIFLATQAVPALVGYVVGPVAGPLYPVVAGIGVVLFLLVYVRPLLVYPVLAGGEREPIMVSLALTKGKARKMVSCLLLPVAPVLIPWVALAVYGDGWLDPTMGDGPRFFAIIVRSALQTAGAIVLSTGLCSIYEALIAEEGETEFDA